MATILARVSAAPASTDLLAEAKHRIANSLGLLVGMVRMQTTLVKN